MSVVGRVVRAALAAAFTLIGLNASPSVAADIRVYSSGAPAEVVRVIAAKFSDASGHRVLEIGRAHV